jgi:hypothetical protein
MPNLPPKWGWFGIFHNLAVAPATDFVLQIRHNPGVPEKPFFRRGGCVGKAAHYFSRGRGDSRFLMKRPRISRALVAIAVSSAALAVVWPHARESGAMLAAQDDPAKLSDIRVNSVLQGSQNIVADQIEAALAGHDAGLAQSFVDLAEAKHIALAEDLRARVSEATAEASSVSHFARRFAVGLVTGDADDAGSLSGTVAGDLLVLGDVRDAVREGKHMILGQDTDRLVLGLATAGLAVTVATYVSMGGVAPVRAGLTLVKDARKVGRLGEGLTEWAGRSARDVVDAPMLEQAVASSATTSPGRTVSAIRAAFNAEKAGALVRMAKDVGRVSEKAGARGALDTLKIAEGPEDVARAARLAETSGGKTRALIKLLGRGALLLTTGAFDLLLWVFGAMFALFSLLASIKATTERLTQAWIDHGKRRRLRRQRAAVANAAANG